MRQVLLRAIGLLRRPFVVGAALLLAGGGTALVFLPLFGLPGYELSAALALGVGLLGGGVGIAAAFQERRLIQGKDPRPHGALRSDSALRSTAMAAGAALTVNVAVLLPPLFASVIYALFSTQCDPFTHVGFFPLLPLPSALIASAGGVLCGLLARRGWSALLFYALLLAASAALTAWPIVWGPQVHAFNHFGGYLPGPLYDEALEVTAPLAWFRAQTLLVAAFFTLFSAFFLDMKEGRITRPHLRLGSFALLAALGLGVLATEERAPSLGIRTTPAFLTEKLGGVKETAHFLIVYPRGKPKEDLERLARDLEFHHAQLKAFLGGAPPERIRVYVYRSPREKQRLVGAANTQFAKPWRLELHVNDAPFPHRVLRHELAHVMAAPFGSGPFRVTARFGVLPNAGIIEGLATAAESRDDDLSLHEWAAGMRKHRLLPDVGALLSPQGFYAAAAPRAYTAAGSFLRHLAETQGTEKLRALYAHGDFHAAYGRSVEALVSEWEAFLDHLPLDERQVNLAFARFRQGSLFSRACAREVATLSQKAREDLRSEPERALALYQRCAVLEPNEPSHQLARARALVQVGKQTEADRVLETLARQHEGVPAIAAEVAMVQADLAYRRGRFDDARAYLEKVQTHQPSPAIDRTARVKLAGLNDGETGKALWAYFEEGRDEVKLLVLREALERDRKNPYLNYLLGRRLLQAEAPVLALGYLRGALAGALPDSLRKEAHRLRIEAEYLSGDCAAVRASVGALPDFGAGFEAAASTWVERCDFEEAAFQGPLVPAGPFR